LAAPSKRPVGRRPRPRWQLKFHFNPEFPQYFSIPPGLVALPAVLRGLARSRARKERESGVPRCSLPGQRSSGGEEGKIKHRRKQGGGRALYEKNELSRHESNELAAARGRKEGRCETKNVTGTERERESEREGGGWTGSLNGQVAKQSGKVDKSAAELVKAS